MYRRILQLSSHKITHAPKIGRYVKALIFVGSSILIVANFCHLATKSRGEMVEDLFGDLHERF